LIIYPKSVIAIHKSAKLKINNGKLFLNASWFDDRKRRYFSELRLENEAELECVGNFSIYQGGSIYVGPNAKLQLGKNSFINTNSTINCFQNIKIGSEVAISDNVSITDSDNHYVDGEIDKMTSSVIIEDNVWIGKNVTILKGVRIGKGSVIGAGSIVVKNIPENSIAVGNPAKVIKQISTWK
jgi:acetyltransferase-like isoleucine patch superfamily enzyme